ncbi:MAG TPA: thioredoxin family protein [Patescibacteria group bacterium]|nr:thioredoxin family protein [Patescibacteria group bacterium]
MSISRLLGLSLLLAVTLAGMAEAGQIRDFDRTAFTHAQQAGQRVMLVVQSPWTPLTQRQKPVFERIARDFHYPDLMIFQVDWERMADVARELRVTKAGTVIVYKGARERGRTTDEADETELRQMLDRAR